MRFFHHPFQHGGEFRYPQDLGVAEVPSYKKTALAVDGGFDAAALMAEILGLDHIYDPVVGYFRVQARHGCLYYTGRGGVRKEEINEMRGGRPIPLSPLEIGFFPPPVFIDKGS